jgi:hypothetical protein
MDATIQVESVFSKSTSVGDLYILKAADNREFSTKRRDLAEKAKALQGQTATVQFKEVQKGQYTNRYLDGIEAAGGAVVTSTTISAAPASSNSNPAASRGVAVKVAAQVLALADGDDQTLANLFTLADGIASYVETGTHPALVAETAVVAADGIPF